VGGAPWRPGPPPASFTSVLPARLLLAALSLAAAAPASPEERAFRLREEALALVPRDDEAGLTRAAGLLEEAARLDPGLHQARADRAMVELLVAAARREEATRLEDGTALMRSGFELRERALEELRPLVRAHPADAAVVRALAVYYGLDGNAAQAARLAGQARAAGLLDPWIDFAEVAARAGGASRAESVPLLAAFAATRPALIRPRMMLARALLDLGRAAEALAALDDLLEASPDHARAKRLKASILAPPPARMEVRPAPMDAPPPRPPGLLPRKRAGGQ